jgi:hypothetical protein
MMLCVNWGVFLMSFGLKMGKIAKKRAKEDFS